MPLRRRLTVLAAAVVGITVALAAVATYVAMRGELRGQVDEALRTQGGLIARVAARTGVLPAPLPAPPPQLGGPAEYAQLLGPGGAPLPVLGESPTRIPLAGDGAEAVADARRSLEDRVIDGVSVRVLTEPLPGERAVQLGRTLETVEATLASLRSTLLALWLAATALAAVIARLVSRRVIAPIVELTRAAEHVEATADLRRRVPEPGHDEVGRLATRFNRMLDRLQAARDAQRQLVADASHELRTPVTSLRTNAEVLRDAPALDDDTRRAVADDVVAQAEELGALVTDVIELARGDAREAEVEEVRLDALAEEAVQRLRRHAPALRVTLDAAPAVVTGAPDRLARAVNNLLDNAAKWSPPGGAVAVRVAGGELEVRDHGPGIPADERPHVFDRFHRGAAARERPGSGLGLAIVKQVADAHGASIALEDAPGGGTVARLRFPTAGPS